MRYNTLADIIKAEDTFEVETGIKSKDRVKKSGEVYTPDWVVNDMLNLIPTKDREDQTGVDNEERVISLDETYLEPACGNGNFLIRIIDRKLNRAVELGEHDIYKNVLKAYMSNMASVQFHSVTALSLKLFISTLPGLSSVSDLTAQNCDSAFFHQLIVFFYN